MSQATISFTDPEQIRTVFGAQDRNLRHVRDIVGVDVIIRGDEVLLQGSDTQIDRARDVFDELRKIVERQGYLRESQVLTVLSPELVPKTEVESEVAGSENVPASIDLFEKARKIHPRSPGQADYVQAIRDNDLVFCTGPAGCGKTYLAVAMAVNALRLEEVRKIVLVRPAVEAGEKLGFLPGDLLAKVNPFLRPLLDALVDILGYSQVKRYMENDVVEIVPLAFMRGRTLNDTFIILDEGQNTTTTQMKMFLTRMGTNSQIVVTGDVTQVDLPPHVNSGLTDATSRLGKIDGVGVVQLSPRDIVRHRLVGEIVRAYDRDTSGSKSMPGQNR